MQLRVGDLTFDALADGPVDGELVLLLHGFPQSAGEWAAQLRALAAAGFRAVAPDQRGYSPGARPEGVDAYRIELLVDDVLGMATDLGAERFHLVGHDWGAIVAWHLAAAAPERLRSLTIVSVPHPSAFSAALNDPTCDQAERSAYFDMLRAPEAAETFVGNDAAGLRGAFEASGLAGHDMSRHVEVLTRPGAMDAACNWYRAFDFHHATLAPITVPTLFVWSDDDVALGRRGAELTEQHVTAPYRFEVLEGESHWIPEAAADRFTPLLLEHVRANRA